MNSTSVQTDAEQSVAALQEESVLTAHLEMGVTELSVRDLAEQQTFYEELVGLQVLSKSASIVTLGHDQRPVIRLIQESSLSSASLGSAGLYHTAILFESRTALAQALERIAQSMPGLYQGSADHLVSEAFYFGDPEGNGVELYFDKSASSWQWQNGEVVMGSQYIDINQYIQQYALTSGSPVSKMGHVHLKVGSIPEAKKFYHDVLGFRVTSERSTALFVSDGQYHHHLGMNVWESSGAGPRSASLGLKSVAMMLDSTADLERLQQRLTQAGIAYEEQQDELVVLDPWKNELRFTVLSR